VTRLLRASDFATVLSARASEGSMLQSAEGRPRSERTPRRGERSLKWEKRGALLIAKEERRGEFAL
jgi:hypothetical protein